jgi:peptidoglycan/LPS O-acetylase OafA/YrhL
MKFGITPSHGNSLDTLSQGRDNNLNLLRLLAATTVLAAHSHGLTHPNEHPFEATLGMNAGDIAVDLFFVASGFLVTNSLVKSGSVRNYAVSRMLRIYPGLWMALLLSTLMVGLAFSDLAFTDYLRQPQTWNYLLKNATMLFGAEAELPGAFSLNPFPRLVNASLWTLRHELRLYVLLGLLWVLFRALYRTPQMRQIQFERCLVAMAIILLVASEAQHAMASHTDSVHLGAMFFIGAAAYVLRRRIKLQVGWCIAGVTLLVLSANVSPMAFGAVYRIVMPYVVLYLAFGPSGRIRRFNNFGDYSYGVYIYAFPIQQMLVASVPGIGGWGLAASSVVTTFLAALVSWRCIEKPALTWKIQITKRWAGDELLHR